MHTDVAEKCEKWLSEIQDHVRDELIPFWLEHGTDKEMGGFLTYFDGAGRPTGEGVKTLVCQTRMIFTYSALERAGLGDGRVLGLAERGVDFLIDRFWDDSHGGWYWTVERDGTPLNTAKLTYGQSFALYALSEYGMASGDLRGMEWASRTFETLQTFAADNRHGGYFEFFERDWTKKPPGAGGGDRKSFDVHMHLMEAFTNLFEATGAPLYRDKSCEMIALICERMLEPEHGTSIAQFSADWVPQRAIIFEEVWGADRDVADPEGRPLDHTSYGHNVEFAWLLGHAVHLLNLEPDVYRETVRRLYDHCLEFGIDRARGGVFCDGAHDGPARERNKEFWQQAECLVGLLDAFLLFDDLKYLDAYESVHRFVMDRMIAHDVGEWIPLFDENNEVLNDALGSAWKINYHTVRSMLQCEARLLKILYGRRKRKG